MAGEPGDYVSLNVDGTGFRSYVVLTLTDAWAVLFDIHKLQSAELRADAFNAMESGPLPGFDPARAAARLRVTIENLRRWNRRFSEAHAAKALKALDTLAALSPPVPEAELGPSVPDVAYLPAPPKIRKRRKM